MQKLGVIGTGNMAGAILSGILGADLLQPGEICVYDRFEEKVKEQAESYGHSKEREYAFLITHSMLHLFGYDHMETKEAEVMEAKQRELLEKLEIRR